MFNSNILPLSKMSKSIRDKFIPRQDFPSGHFKQFNDSIFPQKYRSLTDLYDSEIAQLKAESARATSAQPLPPITNRGVSPRAELAEYVATNELNDALEIVQVFSKGNGNSQLVRIPRPDLKSSSKYSFIDYVNFTVKSRHFLEIGITDHDAVINISKYLHDIFGFGVTDKRTNGLNFYKDSYDLGINGWGTVCIGGQNDSILVTVKGQGLLASKPDWEKRLYKFLNTYDASKLTRIDLAHDNFQSLRSVDDYLNMYMADMFKMRGQNPNVEQAGNWIAPNGKGRTLYIGARSSGKLLRIYEKGKQLSGQFHDLFSNWVRTEIEFSAKQRILPFEMLLKPGQYLSGAYPALNDLYQVQEVIKTLKKTAISTVERAVEITRNQFGKYIWAFTELFGIEETIKKLTRSKHECPKKLEFGNYKMFDKSLNLEHIFTTEDQILI